MESQEPSDSPNNTQSEFAVGDLFVDRYEIESVIGVGGMGKVYRAMHKFMRRTIAIKILHTNLVDNVIALTRFRQEAETVSRLNHPNIVAIHDFGLSPRAYLVMDFLDGTSLGDLLETETHLSPMRSLPIFLQLCDGLTHAHQNGVVHRDLKPSNIMLTTNNGQPDFVKIVDFGIAKLLASASGEGKNLTLTGEVFGSPLYMSPEQCRAKPLDGRSDIYSLGCVMYRTLSGHPPVSGEQLIELLYNHVNSQPPAFSDVCPELGLPEALETIILKCMEKAPENRFQSTQELKDALLAFSLDYNADTDSAGQAVIGFSGLKKQQGKGFTGKVRALRLVTNPPDRGTEEVDRAAKAAEESRAASAAEAGYAATAAEESRAASYAEAGRAASAAEESMAAAAAETGRAFDAAESARAISAAEVSRAIAAAEAARVTSAAEAGRVASAVESERAASAVEAELAASAKEASLAAAAAEAKRAAQATESGGIASPTEMGVSASAAELGRSTSAAEAKRAASAAETARATSASEVGLAAQATEAAFAASAQEALMVASAREAGLAASASESRRVATAAEASRAASAAESVRAASAAESGRLAAAAESGRAASAAETSRVQSVAESGRAQSAAQAIKADSAPRKDETNDCGDDDYQDSNVARS